MEDRKLALLLITIGLLVTILMSLGLFEEIRRVDIPSSKKYLGTWVSLVAMGIITFVAGLHFLVPIHSPNQSDTPKNTGEKK